MKIYTSQINPKIGDFENNFNKIIFEISKAKKNKCDIVLFSELVLTGYPPEDLLFFDQFILTAQNFLKKIVSKTENIIVVIGTVRKEKNKLFNSACIIKNKKILGYKDKTLLPEYNVFNEKRYFSEGKENFVFEYKNKKIAVLICEDSWVVLEEYQKLYEKNPLKELEKLKPDIILNLSASPYFFEKKDLRKNVFSKLSKKFKCFSIIANQIGGNDNLVFDGHSMAFDKSGKNILAAKGFEEDFFILDIFKKYKFLKEKEDSIEDLYKALVLGVKDYFFKLKLQKAIIGLSGGIDSALVLKIAVDALGNKNVLALNMPSRFSSLSSMEDSILQAKKFNVKILGISIDSLFQKYLDLFSGCFENKKFDVTEENIQPRIRSNILMAFSNKLDYLVLSTGNKSELALGYATLYGDMAGGLTGLMDVLKTDVYKIAKFLNKNNEVILKNIIKKQPSAELRLNQKDQDDLPEYEIIDKVIKGFVEDNLSINQIQKKYKIDIKIIKFITKKIFASEFKRKQSPIGIVVTKKSFNKGRFFPIVHSFI